MRYIVKLQVEIEAPDSEQAINFAVEEFELLLATREVIYRVENEQGSQETFAYENGKITKLDLDG